MTADAAGVALIMRWGYRKYHQSRQTCGGVGETGQAVQPYLCRNELKTSHVHWYSGCAIDCFAGFCARGPRELRTKNNSPRSAEYRLCAVLRSGESTIARGRGKYDSRRMRYV